MDHRTKMDCNKLSTINEDAGPADHSSEVGEVLVPPVPEAAVELARITVADGSTALPTIYYPPDHCPSPDIEVESECQGANTVTISLPDADHSEAAVSELETLNVFCQSTLVMECVTYRATEPGNSEHGRLLPIFIIHHTDGPTQGMSFAVDQNLDSNGAEPAKGPVRTQDLPNLPVGWGPSQSAYKDNVLQVVPDLTLTDEEVQRMFEAQQAPCDVWQHVTGVSRNRQFMKFVDQVGKGAFKKVYKGVHIASGKPIAWCEMIALNFLRLEKSRFMMECDIMKAIVHPNIVRMFDTWELGSGRSTTFATATELMTGGTIKEYLRRFQINEFVVKAWGRQILVALDFLHGCDPVIIHRDLTCGNIYFSSDLNPHRFIKIGDLSMATTRDRSYTKSAIGTPGFMAPEMFTQHYNESVDVYAFGICLIEMVTARNISVEGNTNLQNAHTAVGGLKPMCFALINDPEIKKIVEECINVNSTERPTTKELLALDFFAEEEGFDLDVIAKKDGCDLAIMSKKHGFDLENISKQKRFDLEICSEKEVALDPETKSVKLRLRVMDPVKKTMKFNESREISFSFKINEESGENVARELVDAKYIHAEDVHHVGNLIADQIAALKNDREAVLAGLEIM